MHSTWKGILSARGIAAYTTIFSRNWYDIKTKTSWWLISQLHLYGVSGFWTHQSEFPFRQVVGTPKIWKINEEFSDQNVPWRYYDPKFSETRTLLPNFANYVNSRCLFRHELFVDLRFWSQVGSLVLWRLLHGGHSCSDANLPNVFKLVFLFCTCSTIRTNTRRVGWEWFAYFDDLSIKRGHAVIINCLYSQRYYVHPNDIHILKQP